MRMELLVKIIYTIATIIITVYFIKDKLMFKEQFNKEDKTYIRYIGIFLLVLIIPSTIMYIKGLYALGIVLYAVNFIGINRIFIEIKKNKLQLLNEIADYTSILIRELNVSDNLIDIMYEANNNFDGKIIKNILDDVYKKIINENPSKALEYALTKIKNIWLYSVMYSLKTYLNKGDKDIVIDGLNEMVDMLEEEIYIIQDSKTKNNPTIITNYILMAISVIGFVINLIANPYATNYFFSGMTGYISLFLSNIIIYIIIGLNIRMKKGGSI